ncbi:hypothetical protein D3C81_1358090 [compost metagenome]
MITVASAACKCLAQPRIGPLAIGFSRLDQTVKLSAGRRAFGCVAEQPVLASDHKGPDRTRCRVGSLKKGPAQSRPAYQKGDSALHVSLSFFAPAYSITSATNTDPGDDYDAGSIPVIRVICKLYIATRRTFHYVPRPHPDTNYSGCTDCNDGPLRYVKRHLDLLGRVGCCEVNYLRLWSTSTGTSV